METISSTSSFDADLRLAACGVDAERVARFAEFRAGEPFLPMVLTADEVSICRAAPDPALALCTCFCAKEAVRKALAAPVNLLDCRVTPSLGGGASLELADALAREHGVSPVGRISIEAPRAGELAVTVCLFGEAKAR